MRRVYYVTIGSHALARSIESFWSKHTYHRHKLRIISQVIDAKSAERVQHCWDEKREREGGKEGGRWKIYKVMRKVRDTIATSTHEPIHRGILSRMLIHDRMERERDTTREEGSGGSRVFRINAGTVLLRDADTIYLTKSLFSTLHSTIE